MRARRGFRAMATVGLLSLAASGCLGSIDQSPDGGTMSDGGGGGPDLPPYEPVAPASYVPKVKNLLTGLPATDAEVQAVQADPSALKGLIDQWMQLPEFKGKMLDFFRNAFQQNQVSYTQLMSNLGNNANINSSYVARFERSLMDSFALTVWDLVQKGRPLTDAFTTHTYMMTTAMLTFLSYVDEMNVSDGGKTTDRLSARNALTQFTFDPNSKATLDQTLNPSDPNYMIWPLAVTIPQGCSTVTPVTITAKGNYRQLFELLFGRAAYPPCYPSGNVQQFAPTLSDADFSDWRLVTIHPTDTTNPNTTPVFWDLLKLRAAVDVYLHTERMGFFGTPAFDANWGTNQSNEARVTANQALIVAIGTSIAPAQQIVQLPVTANDAMHAADPSCNGCHSILDPYKQFFRQSYTLTYHDQLDATQLQQPANFNVAGVMKSGQGVSDLANIYVGHPRVGIAWTQKMEFWANSTPADEADPEMQRIATAFQNSGYNLQTLVRELFSSPLVTLAAPTQTTTENGVILSIARRDQFCAALSNRLGIVDACGMATPAPTAQQKSVNARSLLMPVDGYYRAFELPALPTNPDLFYRTSTESMCQIVAGEVVDAGMTPRYSSKTPAPAIADMVATVMDIPPSDPRSAPAVKILTDHFANAQAAGATATQAMQSTFTLACISPSSVIVGL